MLFGLLLQNKWVKWQKSEEWHIGATYKILRNGRGLWIITTKEKTTQKVSPLLFFLIPNEKASSIKKVLEEYKNWIGYAPDTFIADCQLSIQNSVEFVYDESKFFLCIFHILRATKKNIEKYISNSNESQKCFNMFYDIAMNAYKEEEIEEKVTVFKEYLNEKSIQLSEYFDNHYFKDNKIKKWAKTYRGDYSMTNNISEALNNKIKRNYTGLIKIRMDKLVHIIIFEISKDFIFETFHGKTIVSEQSQKNSKEENDEGESRLNMLIRNIRATHRFGTVGEKREIEGKLESIWEEINFN